jgi:hypothetical protein
VFQLRCVKSPVVLPRLCAALRILALLTVAAAGARAQSPVSGIAGTVRDSLGAPLELVVVEARDPATGYAARTATNRAGRFILLGLPLGGPYVLQARRVGYVAGERGGIMLTIGARPTADFVLRPALQQLVAVAVRVGAEAGREARIGGSTRIAQAQIDALPNLDRNVAGLAALSPLAGPQLALGGQQWTGTDLRIDGVQSRNQLRAGEANGGPSGIPLDVVREVEVTHRLRRGRVLRETPRGVRILLYVIARDPRFARPRRRGRGWCSVLPR